MSRMRGGKAPGDEEYEQAYGGRAYERTLCKRENLCNDNYERGKYVQEVCKGDNCPCYSAAGEGKYEEGDAGRYMEEMQYAGQEYHGKPGYSRDYMHADDKGTIAQLMVDFAQVEDARLSELHKRERNRLAARKSREKKTKYVNHLKEEVMGLTIANEDLRMRIDRIADVAAKMVEEMDRVIDGDGMKLDWVVNVLLSLEGCFGRDERMEGIFRKFRGYLKESASQPGRSRRWPYPQ